MTCIISTTLTEGLKKQKSLAVIQRYLNMKYKISVGENVLFSRLQSLKKQFAILKMA